MRLIMTYDGGRGSPEDKTARGIAENHGGGGLAFGDAPPRGEQRGAMVVADDVPTMVSEGKRLAAIHPNIVVKLPTCAEGRAATSARARDGIRVNM